MPQPAEFGADAAICSGLDRADDEAIGAAGDHVHLASKPRHPEAVDDVGAAQRQLDGAADGEAEFVRRLDDRAAGRGVPYAPPELFAIDADPQVGIGDRSGAHRGQRVEQQREQQDRRADPAKPQDHLHPALVGQPPLGRADRMPHQQRKTQCKHDRADDQHDGDRQDLIGLFTERSQRRLVPVAGAKRRQTSPDGK